MLDQCLDKVGDEYIKVDFTSLRDIDRITLSKMAKGNVLKDHPLLTFKSDGLMLKVQGVKGLVVLQGIVEWLSVEDMGYFLDGSYGVLMLIA